MKRSHVHAHVGGLDRSMAFYSKMFDAKPTRLENDYAKWMLDEGETTCCYASSDKYWITDPQGIAWEQFHTLGSIPVFSERQPAAAQQASACCATDTQRGKPIGIPVRSSSSCC